MNIVETEKLLSIREKQDEVMKAQIKGSKIEFRPRSKYNREWSLIANPSWEWHNYEYRIAKPEMSVGGYYTLTTSESIIHIKCVAIEPNHFIFVYYDGNRIHVVAFDKNEDLNIKEIPPRLAY